MPLKSKLLVAEKPRASVHKSVTSKTLIAGNPWSPELFAKICSFEQEKTKILSLKVSATMHLCTTRHSFVEWPKPNVWSALVLFASSFQSLTLYHLDFAHWVPRMSHIHKMYKVYYIVVQFGRSDCTKLANRQTHHLRMVYYAVTLMLNYYRKHRSLLNTSAKFFEWSKSLYYISRNQILQSNQVWSSRMLQCSPPLPNSSPFYFQG